MTSRVELCPSTLISSARRSDLHDNSGDASLDDANHSSHSNAECSLGTARPSQESRHRPDDILFSEIRPAEQTLRIPWTSMPGITSSRPSSWLSVRLEGHSTRASLSRILNGRGYDTGRVPSAGGITARGLSPQITFDSISHLPVVLPPKKIHGAFTAERSAARRPNQRQPAPIPHPRHPARHAAAEAAERGARSKQLTASCLPKRNAKEEFTLVSDELICKSREAALAAVQIFNNPQITFKSEVFIVLMNIAWTYMLHAYYRKNAVEYRYFEQKGAKRRIQRTAKGAFKFWELERCLNEEQCPVDRDSAKEPSFLIGTPP